MSSLPKQLNISCPHPCPQIPLLYVFPFSYVQENLPHFCCHLGNAFQLLKSPPPVPLHIHWVNIISSTVLLAQGSCFLLNWHVFMSLKQDIFFLQNIYTIHFLQFQLGVCSSHLEHIFWLLNSDVFLSTPKALSVKATP